MNLDYMTEWKRPGYVRCGHYRQPIERWERAERYLKRSVASLKRRAAEATTASRKRRIASQLVLLADYHERILENWGSIESGSAADHADWADRQQGIADWEDRTGERYGGDW